MRRVMSVVLAMMLMLSMATVVFADDSLNTVVASYNRTNGEANTTGVVKITGIHTDAGGTMDATYDVYKMLHLEGYNETLKAYSYVIVNEWKDFFTTGDGKDYVEIVNSYVKWKGAEDDSRVAEFAKKAQAYAKQKSITPVKTTKNTSDYNISDTTLTFSGLSLGYYLVDSDVGVLCGLTNAKPVGEIAAKNGAPTIQKKVQEDSAESSGTNSYFDSNTADIGQYVKFDVTINVHAGAQNYVFHDKMDQGLTFAHQKDAFGIQHGLLSVSRYNTTASQTEPLTEGTDYTFVQSPTDGTCTFEIEFNKKLCDKLHTNDKIYIVYDAKLNGHAEIGSVGNENRAWVTYGEKHKTTPSVTKTYTYSFDLVKTDGDNKLLKDAVFKLYTEAVGGDPLHIVKKTDGMTYRHAQTVLAGETEDDNRITVTNGMVTVEGLDNGTYYLEEVEAPDGYQKLASRVEFTISDGNLEATIDGDKYVPGTGVQIKNGTASALPTTGAMGTAMFITFGMIVVIGTGVLLVTKKRMSMIQE